MIMNKETLAEMLNGREMGEEITKEESATAKDYGLVVVFGYSDDLAEFRGAIHGEVDCYEGGDIFISSGKVLAQHYNCDCKYCGFEKLKKTALKIQAIWVNDGYSWTYETDIPHATFDIMEDGEKYCRGIVFDIKDTTKTKQ